MGAFSDFTAYAKETGSRLSDQALLVEETQRLSVTQQELFDYITDFGRLSEWIVGAKKSWQDDTNAELPGRVGSVRVIQSMAGQPVRETVRAFESPRMLAYAANDAAFLGLCTDHLGVMTCEPHPNGGTVLCWLAYGRLARNPLKAWAGRKLLQVALGKGMNRLERKFRAC
ncbi:MAG: SRPBCC family protein [Polyangiales bacterium]